MSQVEETMENAPLSESDEILCTRVRQLSTAATLTQSRRDQIHELIRSAADQPDPATAAEQDHVD